ncbi:hypothetical protein HK104_006101 [Borealophlyctis nickersoniae]|nr:hypothetical protein HK104_006101 [Borealophlyctis nickersoniae]
MRGAGRRKKRGKRKGSVQVLDARVREGGTLVEIVEDRDDSSTSAEVPLRGLPHYEVDKSYGRSMDLLKRYPYLGQPFSDVEAFIDHADSFCDGLFTKKAAWALGLEDTTSPVILRILKPENDFYGQTPSSDPDPMV